MKIENQFSIDPNVLYLNSGTQSLSPLTVRSAVKRNLDEWEKNPTEALILVKARMWEVQKALAQFLNADPCDLFLTNNVTVAMNTFVLGIPFEKGEILITDLDYEAIHFLCRYRAERDGHSVRTLRLPKPYSEWTPDKLVEFITCEFRSDTRMLVISHVFSGNLGVFPIAELAKETRRRGILLAVDGAHGPGSQPLNMGDLEDVDFYGGNLHKWVMGPKGTGFGWAPKRHQETLCPLMAGWTTYETLPNYADFGGGSRFASRMSLSSCYDYAPFLALKETFEFWKSFGAAHIREVQKVKVASLKRKLALPKGWSYFSPQHPDLEGPGVAYSLPSQIKAKGRSLMKYLYEEHRLQISAFEWEGETCLRVTPHVYTPDAHLEKSIGILGSISS